jgi:hypothetical protein
MSCEEAREHLLESDPQAEAHASDCPDCAAWVETQTAVRAELRGLAAQMGEPRPEVETALRARFRARIHQARPARWVWAAAAALLIGIGVGAWFGWDEPASPVVSAPAPPEKTPFVLLDYGRPTPNLTAGRLVRVTLPPDAPAWLGLPFDPGTADGIEAEVLLGDDGVAQAVRLVHQSGN